MVAMYRMLNFPPDPFAPTSETTTQRGVFPQVVQRSLRLVDELVDEARLAHEAVPQHHHLEDLLLLLLHVEAWKKGNGLANRPVPAHVHSLRLNVKPSGSHILILLCAFCVGLAGGWVGG